MTIGGALNSFVGEVQSAERAAFKTAIRLSAAAPLALGELVLEEAVPPLALLLAGIAAYEWYKHRQQ